MQAMIMPGQRQQPKHTISFMPAVNTKERSQLLQRLVVIMKNAPRKVAQAWIAAKTKNVAKKMVQLKWIAAKMVNAPKKDMMEKIAANRKNININFQTA